MILFKYNLITFTTLIVATWVMPVTSTLESNETDLMEFDDPDPLIITLRSMK